MFIGPWNQIRVPQESTNNYHKVSFFSSGWIFGGSIWQRATGGCLRLRLGALCSAQLCLGWLDQLGSRCGSRHSERDSWPRTGWWWKNDQRMMEEKVSYMMFRDDSMSMPCCQKSASLLCHLPLRGCILKMWWKRFSRASATIRAKRLNVLSLAPRPSSKTVVWWSLEQTVHAHLRMLFANVVWNNFHIFSPKKLISSPFSKTPKSLWDFWILKGRLFSSTFMTLEKWWPAYIRSIWSWCSTAFSLKWTSFARRPSTHVMLCMGSGYYLYQYVESEWLEGQYVLRIS